MERRCRTCGESKPLDGFASFVDADGMLLTESVCTACKPREPKKRVKKVCAPKVCSPRVPACIPRETSSFRLTPAQRDECKALLRDYRIDVDVDPVNLISSACVFTGVRPAMCLDLLDHKRAARGDNVVPCTYHVRAARGGMKSDEFVRLCRSIVDKDVLDARSARAALAMAARYDAAGGAMFKAMCAAVSSIRGPP